MERYRSGHNGADSKSDGQGNLARGFESHPLRQMPIIYAVFQVFIFCTHLKTPQYSRGVSCTRLSVPFSTFNWVQEQSFPSAAPGLGPRRMSDPTNVKTFVSTNGGHVAIQASA